MFAHFYIHEVGHYDPGFLICELASIVKVLGKLGAVPVVPLQCRKCHQCVYPLRSQALLCPVSFLIQ